MKIKNDAADQWLAVSVELKSGATSTGTQALLSDGLSTIHTGTAGGATLKVTEANVKTGAAAPAAGATWWENASYILTPTLELADDAKAVIAFDANVGLTDTTEVSGNVPTAGRLPALRSAHIPADGFKTNTAANAATSDASNTAT